jgi:hypothetical protein
MLCHLILAIVEMHYSLWPTHNRELEILPQSANCFVFGPTSSYRKVHAKHIPKLSVPRQRQDCSKQVRITFAHSASVNLVQTPPIVADNHRNGVVVLGSLLNSFNEPSFATCIKRHRSLELDSLGQHFEGIHHLLVRLKL